MRAVTPAEYEAPKYVVVNLALMDAADEASLVKASETTSPQTLRRTPGSALPSQANGNGRAIVAYRGAQPPVVAALDGKSAIVRSPSNGRFHTPAQARAEVATARWQQGGPPE